MDKCREVWLRRLESLMVENVLAIQRCCFVVECCIMLKNWRFLLVIQTCRNLKFWPNEIPGESPVTLSLLRGKVSGGRSTLPVPEDVWCSAAYPTLLVGWCRCFMANWNSLEDIETNRKELEHIRLTNWQNCNNLTTCFSYSESSCKSLPTSHSERICLLSPASRRRSSGLASVDELK